METKIGSANNSPCEKNPRRQYSLDNIVHLILASKKREKELEQTGREIGCKRERERCKRERDMDKRRYQIRRGFYGGKGNEGGKCAKGETV